MAPESLLVGQRPRTVRVLLADSSRVLLQRPTVRSDTVYAETELNGELVDTRIALSSIVGIETLEGDAGGTVLLFVGLVLVVGLILKAMLESGLSAGS